MTQELRALTSLRMVAALLVFIHHYSGLPYSIVQFLLQAVAVEGHVGVSIFLVLSGFLIELAYYTLVQENRFSYRDYLVKRFARIIPLYWVLLGITCAVSAARNAYRRVDAKSAASTASGISGDVLHRSERRRRAVL